MCRMTEPNAMLHCGSQRCLFASLWQPILGHRSCPAPNLAPCQSAVFLRLCGLQRVAHSITTRSAGHLHRLASEWPIRLPFSSSAIVMAPRHFVQCLSASQFIDMGWARRSSDEIDALIAELETDELTFEQFQVGPISEAAIRMCRECR